MATFKKFQQGFCNDGVIESILGEKNQILEREFQGLWSLEDYDAGLDLNKFLDGELSADFDTLSQCHKAIVQAIRQPNDYVIKPQKEGGGNNFYDDEAKDLLLKFISKDTKAEERDSLRQYLIMTRITPPKVKTWMLKDSKLVAMDSLSELGLYSSLFIDTAKDKKDLIMKNENFGTLMRTKGSHSNEGGVNAGYAVIDTPILYEGDGKYDYKGNAGFIAPNVDDIPE